ncbi:MAG TPA: glycerol-3-phosphate dehydrogenase/oxidase [Acidimicrobiia bacterium]|nr:glycerol-3-phosphate dehydrogenase/oxidase [Acidimicrobiia bacterium]
MTFDRAEAIRRLTDESFDVLVVGGGITGTGVALDAASRGLRVALVDKGDFASGTSSKSSKLVHGGIRYLQQKEVGLVYEALAERQILRKTAPHLVRVLPFLLPVFTKDGLLPRRIARLLGATMWAYDLTGGLRIGKLHKRVSKEEALRYMPTLPADNIAASYIYYDAQADDARLTLTVAKTAAAHGAAVVNYATLVGVVKDAAGKISGARVRIDDDELEVRAHAIVNATGVWSDQVRALDDVTHDPTIRPAKGIHITVPWSLVRNEIAVVIPVPKDRRSVFVVPWGGDGGPHKFTYIGTTDTDYDGPVDDPQITAADVEYLLRAINGASSTKITEADILGTWAGLRPLVAAAKSERTADLSRRHSVHTSPAGVVTVTGGKLTTYRRMAADAVDEVAKLLGRSRSRSRTKRIRLRGADGWDASDIPKNLAERYGSDGRAVADLERSDPQLARPLIENLPYSRAEVVYAARAEMACTVDDVLSRRTRTRLLARDASAAVADDVAALMGAELGWSDDERRRQVARYQALVTEERTAGGLPETALDALSHPPS